MTVVSINKGDEIKVIKDKKADIIKLVEYYLNQILYQEAGNEVHKNSYTACTLHKGDA